MARPTARGVALEALVAVEQGARANVVVPRLLDGSNLDERDRNLVTELVYGTCRMRRACDWLSDRYVKGRLDDQVRCAIRMGVYQLVWTRIPAHAAVSATVGEVNGPGRSVANAVLRRCATTLADSKPRWPDPATELSYPDWIVELLSRDLGPSDARGALEIMNQPAEATPRPDGYIQDRASQMVAAHVARLAGRDTVVLDVCAAPGGKATALAAAGARLVAAADLLPARALVVAANARRLGASSVATVVADGAEPPWRSGSFDAVLVDAPCSGLGVLRRRPDARWRMKPGDVERLARIQKQLLSSSLPLVRPGGLLAYSVCTLTAAETAGVDNWLSRHAPGFGPLPPPGPPWRPAGRGAMLLPQAEGTDGMFLLALHAPQVG
ncbi:MAG TPA: transcription antitermination factor NusB [Acidimicrobiales bacterium]|nr:transcription antitermination factor NusB [Acidimicrobiales bacterium]